MGRLLQDDATIRVKVSAGLFSSERTIELPSGQQYFVSANQVWFPDQLFVRIAEEDATDALVYFATTDGTRYAKVPLSSFTWRRWIA